MNFLVYSDFVIHTVGASPAKYEKQMAPAGQEASNAAVAGGSSVTRRVI